MEQSSGYSGSTHDIREKATGQFEQLAEMATDNFKDMANQADDVAHRQDDHGREAGERMQEVAGHFKGAVDRSVTEQPMATLAMAAVVGFVLGALWKS